VSAAGFPPIVEHALSGWNLTWFRLVPTGEGADALADLRTRLVAATRDRYDGVATAELEEIAAMRSLFRAAGTDPTRYRPSSEALLRRVLKGNDLPAIHPLVDLNNLLSLVLLAPCCVIDPQRVEPPFRFRRGADGEAMESMRGPFALGDRPLLEDAGGPFGTPITDSERVMVRPDTDEVWLVVYGPEAASPGAARQALEELLEEAPVATLTTEG